MHRDELPPVKAHHMQLLKKRPDDAIYLCMVCGLHVVAENSTQALQKATFLTICKTPIPQDTPPEKDGRG